MRTIKLLALLFALLPVMVPAKTRVLFIGDSITDGAWGNSGGGSKPSSERSLWDMNHIYGHGYMYLCAAHYQGHFPSKNYEFYNRGISGNTLSDLERRWKDDAIGIRPDVMSILIDTNDVNEFLKKNEGAFDFESWEKCYRRLLDMSLENNPNLKLVLCAPFVANTRKMRKSTNYEEREMLIEGCAEIVKRIARDYKAIYLPYNKLFKDLIRETSVSQDTYWIWDGIHPTAAGHQQMPDMWIKAVDRKK